MSLRINTNELAIGAQRNLAISSDKVNNIVQRLASGSRIVRASDDPAGLAISDSLNAQIRSLNQATRNTQDGISLIQVFEGGTNEINNMLTRVRELAIQAASDTVGDNERIMLNNEATELLQEVTRTAKQTQYQGTQLLSGNNIEMEFQVGINNNPDADRIRFAPGDSNMTGEALGVSGITLLHKTDAQESLTLIDTAVQHVNEVRARVGATQSRLNSTMQAQMIYEENLSAAKSRIRDMDVAEETTNLAKNLILREAGVAVLSQANETPKLALQLLRSF